MSKIQGKPFIELVVDTLGDLKADFLDLVNGSDKTPEFRSLITASAKITGSDKGKVQYVVLETWSKTYTGYLIYNNTYCVLVAFGSNTQALTMLKINVAKQTFETVKEYLDINELRRYLEEASEHITTGEIDSGEALAGQVLAADGAGGASWENTLDTITPETVQSGDAVQLFGFDAQGNLVKDDMPEGIVVDDALNTESDNAIANKPVAEKFAQVDEALESKANVDGNYPTMTVGVADQLSPYDENSGDDQDEPFSFQATGTGNGSQPDFATGSIALMKEKQGNTVVVNQHLQDFAINSNSQYIQATDGNIDFISGHKYIFIPSPILTGNVAYYINTPYQELSLTQPTLITNVSSAQGILIYNPDEETINVTLKNKLIDLTQWFNGDIPQDLLDHPDHFFRYYQGSLAYNEGTLVNANGRYIKCIGMNQWDEEWEQGNIDNSGQNISSTTTIRSKNFIRVIPNKAYYCYYGGYASDIYGIKIMFYDKDKNYIDGVWSSNTTFTPPANCEFVRFKTNADAVVLTTYNHDISINLYYEDESRCLTHEPYQLLTDNDTGTETLRSAGSVFDSKIPNGTITRRVGSYTFTGSETFTYVSDSESMYKINEITNVKSVSYGTDPTNLISNTGLEIVKPSVIYNGGEGITCYDNAICIHGNDTSGLVGKTVYFELATPTTEQGTPFSENVEIDDFGSMSFEGTNGVPQGALIFYPVDYKAYLDTLHKYTDGDPDNLALKSDLSADKTELQGVDIQLLNAIGGTLRNIIAFSENTDITNVVLVNLGEQNWRYENGIFETELSYVPKTRGEDFACTFGYSNSGEESSASMSDDTLQMITTGTGRIWVKDSTYGTDATTFKAAMKGVLLAYEKASE